MAFMAALPYIAGAVAVAGSYLTGQEANKSRDKALEAAKNAQQLLMDAGAPPDVARQLVLQEFQAQGMYTPELEKDVQAISSEMAKVQDNQQAKDLQLSALKGIQERAQGGLTAADRVAMMNIQDQIAQAAQSERAATQQSLQQRGLGGGGAEIAGMIAGGQGAMQQGAQAARGLMASQSQQALNALAQQGSMAGSIRGQDYDIASAKARAADEMNRFSIQNQMAVEQRNIGAKNLAGMANWQNVQNIKNMNTAQSNTEQQRQAQAKQWMYDAELRRRGGVAGAAQNVAQQYGEQAKGTAAINQGAIDAITGMASVYAKDYAKQDKDTTKTT